MMSEFHLVKTEPEASESELNHTIILDDDNLDDFEHNAGPIKEKSKKVDREFLASGSDEGFLDIDFGTPEFTQLIGEENFSLEFLTNSCFYKYSTKLNKLYTEMEKPIVFTIHADQLLKDCFPYFIRITPFFSNPEYWRVNVIRCSYHSESDNEFVNGIDSSNNDSFIKLEYPTPNYIRHNGRPAILSKLKFDTKCSTQVQMKCLCLSSCPGGCNRRNVAVVVELLDNSFFIRGRLVFNLRVCASPMRDLGLEEKRLKRSHDNILSSEVCNDERNEEDCYVIKIKHKKLYENVRKYYEDQLLLLKLQSNKELLEVVQKQDV